MKERPRRVEEHRSPIKIRFGIVAVYVFVLLLVQLGRIHIGLLFGYAMYLLIAAPLFSILHLVLSTFALKYNQEFDTDHPIKGEHLTYTLSLANESYIGSARMRISFTTTQPGSPTRVEDLDLTLKRSERFEKSYTISCPFRGIYTVGLDRMELSDVFGWVTVSRPVWHKTFYVYPRVIDAKYPFTVGDVSDLSTGPNPGASQDYSLFESLTRYRSGESVRHLAWKKFFALGEPFLKSYARTSQPGIIIYFDLRRDGEATSIILEREDCSVEILVSLVKYFLEREVPVSVHAMGQSRYRWSGESNRAFDAFHRDTVNLIFTPTISPAELFQADAATVSPRSSVLFITHRFDALIAEIMDDAIESSISEAPEVALIVNQTSMDDKERTSCDVVFGALREKGAHVLEVRGTDSLVEDLAEARS
jgi:uncharacterized protein (DUF58 family)